MMCVEGPYNQWFVSYQVERQTLDQALKAYGDCTTTAKANGTWLHGSTCRDLIDKARP